MQDKLEAALGKSIGQFCGTGFVDASTSHCAHFVSHILGCAFGFTCRQMTGKGGPTATIRVHELFPQCPQVGRYGLEVLAQPTLIFVTRPANVDLEARTMRNVPKKHVGIYCDGQIYHYSNTQDAVIKQSPADFLNRFRAAYSPDVELFWGSIPASSSLGVAVPVPAAPQQGAVHLRKEESPSGQHRYFATIGAGAEFFVASRVRYKSGSKVRFGLRQSPSEANGPLYDARDYVQSHGQAAWLAHVIGINESNGRFNCLNTYDRAAFTFGFFQLAAHTPGDNLILLFRRSVAIPEFAALFPDLRVADGRLHRVNNQGDVDLEVETPRPDKPSEKNLGLFMAYLNSDQADVDDTELVNAAKLVALTASSAAFRELQVRVALGVTMDKIRRIYDPSYDLDGKSDTVCFIIADIHHQGRAKKAEVRSALASSNAVGALLRLGQADFPERCASLTKTITSLRADGTLDAHMFSRSSGLFVPRSNPFPD